MKFYHRWSFSIRQRLFRWVQDEDGDVGLQIAGIVTFIKYKDMAIVYWFKKFERAGKWQGYESPSISLQPSPQELAY